MPDLYLEAVEKFFASGKPYVLLLICTVFIIVLLIPKPSRLKKETLKGKFLSAEEFNRRWITKRKDGKTVSGFKVQDRPGCYVILIFDKPVRNGRYQGYKNVYVGQSIHVFQRVRNHLTGHGNGEVYADVKYGKHVYVQIVPCKQEDLNRTEIRLIEAFDATRSYNKTVGGAKRRYSV